MTNILIANSEQLDYASLKNGLTSQYSMENKKYPKALILAENIIKNHQHDDSGTRKSEHENFEKPEFQGKNKIAIWKQKPQSNKEEE